MYSHPLPLSSPLLLPPPPQSFCYIFNLPSSPSPHLFSSPTSFFPIFSSFTFLSSFIASLWNRPLYPVFLCLLSVLSSPCLHGPFPLSSHLLSSLSSLTESSLLNLLFHSFYSLPQSLFLCPSFLSILLHLVCLPLSLLLLSPTLNSIYLPRPQSIFQLPSLFLHIFSPPLTSPTFCGCPFFTCMVSLYILCLFSLLFSSHLPCLLHLPCSLIFSRSLLSVLLLSFLPLKSLSSFHTSCLTSLQLFSPFIFHLFSLLLSFDFPQTSSLTSFQFSLSVLFSYISSLLSPSSSPLS